jgi:hypothetical protein
LCQRSQANRQSFFGKITGSNDPLTVQKDKEYRLFTRQLLDYYEAVINRIKDNPNLPNDFWAGEIIELGSIIPDIVTRLAENGIDEAVYQLGKVGIDFDPDLTNERAKDYALKYSSELIGEINETSLKWTRESLSEYFDTPGSTLGSLVESLSKSFSKSRAETIAITEVTRIYAQVQNQIYQEAGLEPAQFIPAAHHRCRCWTRVKQIDGELRIVWQTNQDEMVCKQPIVTPWGTVAGCRELHGTILSTGVKV